jgi:HK97 family phage prohead protease
LSERLSPCFELKFAGDALTRGEFRGYASTFGGAPDSYGDVIAPGAFAASLRKHEANGTAPAMFWAHDPSEPIGVWKALKEDAHGLAVEGKLTLDVQRARDAHALMKDGALGLSIGYRTLKSDFRSGVRVLTAVDLFEASLVAVPANPNARVTAVKSAPGRPRDIGELRDALIYAGLSVREAKRAAGPAWRALERIDDDESQELAALLKSAALPFTA